VIGKNLTRNEISGGIFFSAVIQGRDITVMLPRELTPAMAGLRDASAVFTGRDGDLEQLIGLIDPAAEPAPRTMAVSGLPGVGKTELVVHAAHAALRAGWFPGGVLFIDMFGYDPDPDRKVTADAALDSLLRAVGMPAEHIPAAEQDRSRLFASVLARYAEEGRPVLVVIDNVSAAAQVTPLVPAAGKVLVTSRHRLPLQNARRLELDKLSEAAGVELLAAELALVVGTDTRVAAQSADAAAIARLCDGLPLALQIVAALLAAHPSRLLSSMAADLQDARTRLDEMRYREPGGAELAVRSAFDLSYRQLDTDQAMIFRLLPLNQGPEISAAAVAAMASLGELAARRSLEELERAHLIEAGSADRRWRMHDLLRIYALGLADESDDMPRAMLLLLAYYVDTAHAAVRQLEPTAARPEGPFADRAQALAWLDTEYPNLTPYGNLVIVEPAVLRPYTADLFPALWRYFELRRLTDDWIRLTNFALHVARGLGDRKREADALTKLSGGLRHARRFDEAIAACQEAVGIQRERGDRRAEGIALNNLAAAQSAAGRYAAAITSTQAAAAIFGETGDRHREGIALANLGGALIGLDRYAESIAAYQQALSVFRETGDRHGEGTTLMNLGTALRAAGQRSDEAAAAEQAALTIMSEAGDQHGAILALVNLAATRIEAGQLDGAVTAADEAVTQARRLSSPDLEGLALINLALALGDAGRSEQAAEVLRDAAAAYHRGGDGDGEADARSQLGNVLRDAGLLTEAAEAYRAAADHYHQTGNWEEEGRPLFNLALALRKSGRFQEAIEPIRGAVSAYREAGNRGEEANSLILLGTVLGCGRIDEAISAYRDAAAIYRESGDRRGVRRALRLLRANEEIKSMLDAGSALLAAGQYEEALTGYRQAASAFRQLGDRHSQGIMSASLGTALRGAGRFGEAIAALAEAAGIFGDLSDADREHEARAELTAAQQDQASAQAAAAALGSILRSTVRDGKQSAPVPQDALTAAYRYLGPHDARLFRLLSACPGPDVSTAAAAILAVTDPGTVTARHQELASMASSEESRRLLFRRFNFLYGPETKAARDALTALARMRLVTRDVTDPERWRLPDLVRPFAAARGREHAKEDLRDQARALLFLYYLAGTHAASGHLEADYLDPASDGLPDEQRAVAWLEAEYPNLIATVAATADGDELDAIVGLSMTRSLVHITSLRERFDDAVKIGLVARQAARRLKDRHAEAVVLRNLGGALMSTGRPGEAISQLQAARAAYQELGDLVGDATTLTNLGAAYLKVNRYDEAVSTLRAAAAAHHRTERPYSEAVALGNLGGALIMTDQLDEAVEVLWKADRIYRQIGELHNRSGALANLGGALCLAGRAKEAIKPYRDAAALARATGDHHRADRILALLADTYRETGQHAKASAILRDLGN